MFRITGYPYSGSFIQCLAKITVMVLSCPLIRTQSMLWQHIYPWLFVYTAQCRVAQCVLHNLEWYCVCTAKSRVAQ